MKKIGAKSGASSSIRNLCAKALNAKDCRGHANVILLKDLIPKKISRQ